MSLDGFIARKDGSVDFLEKYEKGKEDYGYKKFYDSIGTIIMGNTTYKQFGHTPEFDKYYENKPIFVFSRKPKDKKKNITFVKENVKKLSKKLKGNVWMLGGASIFNEFLKHDLIDEFIITVMPVILGEGISLFDKKNFEKSLKLLDVKKYDLGVVQLRYKR